MDKRILRQRAPGSEQSPLMRGPELSRIRAVLVLGGVPWDDLEDGVQQVQVKLIEEQAKSDRSPITNRSGWLAVVASRVAADWHRDHRRDSELHDRLAQRWSRHGQERLEKDRVLALVVADALERLSATQRQILVLRYYEDLTLAEIARVLDIPEGTVKSRLHAAASAMRARLNEMEVT